MLKNNPEIIRWINKHSNETIKQAYSMTKSDILKDEMFRRVFERIDYTNSGKVKIEEFALIFTNFNIQISKNELQAMFNMADRDQSGDLSFNEFKQMVNDQKIQEIYRAVIDRHRDQQEKIFGPGRTKTYLPYDLTKLLENFSYQGRRDHIEDSSDITEKEHPYSVSKTYVKLFLLGHNHNSIQPSHVS